jgi:hypothetical protein
MFLELRCFRIGIYLKVESLVKFSFRVDYFSGEFLSEEASSIYSGRG